MKYTKDNPKLVKYFYIFKGIETFTGVVKDKNYNIAYYLNGKYHRIDGPAIEYVDGDKFWYLNGKRHREGGPAVEIVGLYAEWFLNGKYHRENGPAIEYTNGDKHWYLNDQLHREDGPAIEKDNENIWIFNPTSYGKNDDFTNESWKKFINLLILK